jgi:hypothetical protein
LLVIALMILGKPALLWVSEHDKVENAVAVILEQEKVKEMPLLLHSLKHKPWQNAQY